jgi:hypothetical protein
MSAKSSAKSRKFRDSNHSSIGQHKKSGKLLVPPFNSFPSTNKVSWRDDAAPEMLWAFLVAQALPREEYLECFRRVVLWCKHNLPGFEERVKETEAGVPQEITSPPCAIELTELALLSNENFDSFAQVLRSFTGCIKALGCLKDLESLPGHNHWMRCFSETDMDWDSLAQAVAPAMDHQSEISTDIRWLKVISSIVLGTIQFPASLLPRVDEIRLYPNSGDLRQVRPSIRSMEMVFRREVPEKWIAEFWDEIYRRTRCIDSSISKDFNFPDDSGIKHEDILRLRDRIEASFFETTTSTNLNARHDAAFGVVLYAISLGEEICAPINSSLIVGRFGLRTLVELLITFSYLAVKDDLSLWFEYRNFGNGQTKLAFLKTELATGALPAFVSQETLFELANEDSWQEYVDVNTGHWASKNLRALAMDGGTKDVYDKYYDWTSTYSHGHWGAIRDSNFVTCLNPLHRFHRIPRRSHRVLPAVASDAIGIINSILDVLQRLYPVLQDIPRLMWVSPETPIE